MNWQEIVASQAANKVENYDGEICPHCVREKDCVYFPGGDCVYFEDIDGHEIVLCPQCCPGSWKFWYED